jgi:hypothetical protein
MGNSQHPSTRIDEFLQHSAEQTLNHYRIWVLGEDLIVFPIATKDQYLLRILCLKNVFIDYRGRLYNLSRRFIIMQGKKRPILIAIIGFLTILVAVLILLGAVLALFSDTIVDLGGTGLEGILDFIGYGGLLVGIIFLIVGIGIWRGWAIMWYIAVIIYILGAASSIISIALAFTNDDVSQAAIAPLVVSLVICVLVLYYLFRPKVKEFFNI